MVNDQEFINIISSIAQKMHAKFTIPGYDYEDIRQFLLESCLTKRGKYNKKRGSPYNYFFVICNSRMKNLLRNKVERVEKPCHDCPFKAYIKDQDKCIKHHEKLECSIYKTWFFRNESKKNINSPIGITEINPNSERNTYFENNTEEKIFLEELKEIIDKNLDVEHRKDFLIFLNGGKISKIKEKELLVIIRKIAEENLDDNNW